MEKETIHLEKRLVELSNIAYTREIITFSDFLNLNELNILHTLPKSSLYAKYYAFGGYAQSERQMVAFFHDALYLRVGEIKFPFGLLEVVPASGRYHRILNHRDYLGSILSLGISRGKIGDILTIDQKAYIYCHDSIMNFLHEELRRVGNVPVTSAVVSLDDFSYTPQTETLQGSISSERLDSIIALAFKLSRSSMSGLIDKGKVFVNSRLVLSNSYILKEDDVISVRGKGKFKYGGILKKTKKGRLFVGLEKYL